MNARRLLLPAAVYALILGLSSLEQVGPPLPVDLSVVGHIVEYGALGASLAWALAGIRAPVTVTLLAVAVLGTLDELYQSTTPGRVTSALDLLVDVTAATIAAAMLKGATR